MNLRTERERETDKVFSCLWLSDREAIIGRISGQNVGREREREVSGPGGRKVGVSAGLIIK